MAAIRADIERGGGYLATLLLSATEERLAKLDVTGDLANTANADDFKADVSGIPALVAAEVLVTPDNKIATNAENQVAVDIDSLDGGFTDDDRAQQAAILAKLETFNAAAITIQSPVLQNGALQLVKGDDYTTPDGRSLLFTLTGLGVAIGDIASIGFSVKRSELDDDALFAVDTEFEASGDDVLVTVELESAQTLLLSTRLLHPFYLTLTLDNGHTITKLVGSIEVVAGGG